jgi:hypothetical protein
MNSEMKNAGFRRYPGAEFRGAELSFSDRFSVQVPLTTNFARHQNRFEKTIYETMWQKSLIGCRFL